MQWTPLKVKTILVEYDCLLDISEEFERFEIKGPSLNGKLTKLFQDLTYNIFKEGKLQQLVPHLSLLLLKIAKGMKLQKLTKHFGKR